jgi:hypothetical protein
MFSIYPSDWAEMTMLVNSVVLNALRQLSHTIRDRVATLPKIRPHI